MSIDFIILLAQTAILIHYFFLFLISVFSLYFLGKLGLSLIAGKRIKTNETSLFFAKLLCGIIFFTIIIAVVFSKGKTALIFLLIPFSGIVFYLKKHPESVQNLLANKKINLHFWAELFIVSILLFAVQATKILKTGDFPFYIQEHDYVFYTEIADALIATGQENTFSFLNQLSVDYHTVQPYHYFEMWFVGGLSKGLFANSMLIYYFVFVPLFGLLLYIGLKTILETLVEKHTRINKIIAFLLLFLGVNYFPESTEAIFGKLMLGSPLVYNSQKMIALYVFYLVSFWFFLRKEYVLALISLLIFPIVSIATFPAVLSGACCLVVVLLILNQIQWKEVLNFIAMLLLVFGGIGCFYIAFKTNSTLSVLNTPILDLTDMRILSIASFKIMLIEISYRIFSRGVLINLAVLLWILVAVIDRKKKTKRSAFVYAGIFVSGAVIGAIGFSAVFYRMRDNWAFFEDGSGFMLTIFCWGFIALLCKVFKNAKFFQPLIIFILLVNAIVFFSYQKTVANTKRNAYSDVYLSSINQWFEANKAFAFGCYIKGANEYQDYISKHALVNRLGNYTVFMKGKPPTFDISNAEITTWSGSWEKQVEEVIVFNSPFYRFLEEQKQSGTFVSVSKSQLDFIKYYNIQFLVVSSQAVLSEEMKLIIKETITDSISGERFCVIDVSLI